MLCWLLLIALFAYLDNAHMVMKYPMPRGYLHNLAYTPIDYNLNAPLDSLNMCKGKPPGETTATLYAGQNVNVQFEGVARHGGGMCQFSVSYDDDKSFIVLQTIHGSCPDASYSWPVYLPENLPSCERCTFAWSWINAIGNREYYMNCADVRIIGKSYHRATIFGPGLTLANIGGYSKMQPTPAYDGPNGSNTKTIRSNVRVIGD